MMMSNKYEDLLGLIMIVVVVILMFQVLTLLAIVGGPEPPSVGLEGQYICVIKETE